MVGAIAQVVAECSPARSRFLDAMLIPSCCRSRCRLRCLALDDGLANLAAVPCHELVVDLRSLALCDILGTPSRRATLGHLTASDDAWEGHFLEGGPPGPAFLGTGSVQEAKWCQNPRNVSAGLQKCPLQVRTLKQRFLGFGATRQQTTREKATFWKGGLARGSRNAKRQSGARTLETLLPGSRSALCSCPCHSCCRILSWTGCVSLAGLCPRCHALSLPLPPACKSVCDWPSHGALHAFEVLLDVLA